MAVTIMILQLQNITKSFGVDVILENISLQVDNGEKVGLIGANGAGKTTLLNIITGQLSHDSGNVVISKDTRVGFLKQSGALNENNTIWQELMGVFADVVQLEQEMRALELQMGDASLSEAEHQKILDSYGSKSESFEKQGGFELRARIMGVLNGMGFADFDVHAPIAPLSGGEKTKLAMAKLLLEEPDLLLLDEPTNHLDFQTMQWLEGYLRNYRKAVLVVSHDRYFLDALVTAIYEVERTHATRYTGNYSRFVEQKQKSREDAWKDYNQQQKEIKRMEEYVAKNIVRASTTKMAQSRQKAIDRMEKIERPDGDLKRCRFRFDLEYTSYKEVLEAEDLQVMVSGVDGERVLFSHANFQILRGEKIALIGANGVGKSTLLKTLLGLHKEYAGRFAFGRNVDIGYYDQEQKTLHEDKSVLNEIWDRVPRMDESQVRTMLGGLLFTDEDVFKLVRDLSGGEKAKLEFLILMLQRANTLFLDEPTNHLDLSSKEALDDALMAFEGTIFLVSHDRYFLNKVADKIFELTPQGVAVYEGNYDAYLAKRQPAEQTTYANAGKSVAKENSYEQNKRRQASIKSVTRKLTQAEEDIAAAEARMEQYQQEMDGAGADFALAQEKFQLLQQTEAALENLYEVWDNLNAELENLQNCE